MTENPFELINQRLSAIERNQAKIIGMLRANELKTEYLNTKETASFLKLSKASLYRLTMNNEVPLKRVNGRLFFNRKDLEFFVENNGKTK